MSDGSEEVGISIKGQPSFILTSECSLPILTHLVYEALVAGEDSVVLPTTNGPLALDLWYAEALVYHLNSEDCL